MTPIEEDMDEPRFTICYRQYLPIGGLALLVQDTDGGLYVFTGDIPRPYLHASLQPTLRAATLRRLGWSPVPVVSAYSLLGLRRLIVPARPITPWS
jgi:hypothetical protein